MPVTVPPTSTVVQNDGVSPRYSLTVVENMLFGVWYGSRLMKPSTSFSSSPASLIASSAAHAWISCEFIPGNFPSRVSPIPTTTALPLTSGIAENLVLEQLQLDARGLRRL